MDSDGPGIAQKETGFNIQPLNGIKPKRLSKQELEKQVELAKKGDEKAYEKILGHLHGFICYIARGFFIQGAEPQDVYQEAAIKLLNVIDKYEKEKGSFVSFAQSSIKKHIITNIKKEQAKKRSVLNTSFSLNDETRNKEGETITFMDTITNESEPTSSIETPFDIIQKDYEDYLVRRITKALSQMEAEVFVLRYTKHFSYKEIARSIKRFKKN